MRTSRADTSSLISGKSVAGNRGLGVLGSNIPSTGTSGPPPLYNDISLPSEASDEFRALLTSTPVGGTFFMNEDSSFVASGFANGTYSGSYQGFKDGVSYGTASFSFIVGDSIAVSTLTGSVAITGLAPVAAITQGIAALPGSGAIAITGLAPAATTTHGTLALPGTGAIALSGLAPAVVRTLGTTAQPGAGALSLTGLAPTAAVTHSVVAQPGVGSIAIAGQIPAVPVGNGVVAQPSQGSVALTGLAPTAVTTHGVIAQPGVGAIAISGAPPAAITSAAITAQPAAGAVAIAGLAPAVSIGASASPAAGQVAIAGLAPAALIQQYAAPGTADLQIVGYGPQIIVSDHHVVQPEVGSISVAGAAPIVNTDSTGGGASAGQVWNYVLANGMTAQATLIDIQTNLQLLLAKPIGWDTVLETAFTAADLLRIIAAVAAGKTTISDEGNGNAHVEFTTVDETQVIVSAEMEGSERASVTITP